MKRTRYAFSKRHCMDLNSLPEYCLEDFLSNKVKVNHTLFTKHSIDDKFTILLVCVDDMIVIGDNEIEKITLKEKLVTQFEIKELGKLKYFLGIEVSYSKQRIFVFQRKYVLNLLKETRKLGCKIQGYLLNRTIRLGVKKIDGILIYLSHIRSNIAYVVIVVKQFMHDPKERYLQAVIRILQYLKISLGKNCLFIKEGIISIEIYKDTDYALSIEENLVIWRSKKQDVVDQSSVEMKIIHDNLKVKYEGPIKLFCDNNLTISIAHNLVQHKIKHIEILDNELIVTTHVLTGFQVENVFTKGLPIARF
ncbi:Copia protein, partial [Mucuna pruriens]